MIAHRFVLILAIALHGSALHARGAQESAAPPPTNVLLVTVDALRADRLGCHGRADAHTPAIDALAARGTRFERAYAHCPLTLPAHASLLSGRTPLEHGLHDDGSHVLAPEVPTLAESFVASGYRTAAFVSALELSEPFGLSRGFELYDDDLGPPDDLKALKRTRGATETTRAALRWLETADERPFFCWVHLADPAAPYEPPHSIKQIVTDPYQGEVAHVDASLGKLLDALRTKGLEQRTLIVLVGGFGEALGEHGEATHGALIFEPTVRVPLVLALPERVAAGAVASAPVGQSDVAPTIAELAGVAAPAGATGRSFAATAPAEDAQRSVYLESELCARRFGWSTLRGIVRGNWKYVRAPQPLLFDLSADPGEATNLVEREPARAAELRTALDARMRAGREQAVDAPIATGSVVQSLAALDSEPLRAAGPLREGEGVDPAQRIASVNEFGAALQRAWAGRPTEMVEPLARAVAASPDTAMLHVALAIAYERTRRFEEALNELAIAIELEPESSVAHYYMARMQTQTGQPEMAEAFYQRAAELGPDSLRAQQAMTVRLGQEGRLEDALPYMRRVVALEPLQQVNWQRYFTVLRANGEWAELARATGEAARLFEDELYYPNYEAWVLATSPLESARDPERALSIARGLAERTDMKDPGIIDTLAAALAASGDFEEAQAVLSKGVLIVHEMKLEPLLTDMRARLALYQEQKPFVESK